jgi:hypothetical protein
MVTATPRKDIGGFPLAVRVLEGSDALVFGINGGGAVIDPGWKIVAARSPTRRSPVKISCVIEMY